MKAESLVFAIAGIFFGVIVGWMLGSQQALKDRPAAAPVAQQSAPPAAAPGGGQQRAPLDQSRVQALRTVAEQNPKDPEPRVQLGNLYFDAEQYNDAITWYESAHAFSPRDANVSTDLGVAYHYSNQPDRALAQFERSLAIDPKHTKTLFNLGIVKAFGKQDLHRRRRGLAAGGCDRTRFARRPGRRQGPRGDQKQTERQAGGNRQ